MPKPKLPHNRGLPARWRQIHNAYYYQVPPGLESRWDGKRQFRLGKTLAEAYATYAARVNVNTDRIEKVGPLLDRYSLEVVPKKSPAAQDSNRWAIKKLRSVFAEAPLTLDNWPQLVYQYIDRRKKKVKRDGKLVEVPALTVAHREIEVLSHAFTKAVQWGFLKKHPFKFEIRLDGDLALKPRTRYVEDWEIVECLSIQSRRKSGSVKMIQAYIKLKLLTGLARSDLLRLRQGEHLRDDGIHVTRHKTKDKTGKKTIYEYATVPERKAAVEEAIKARPVISPFLFCNRRGEGYMNEATGTAHGFDSIWSRFMDRVLKETTVSERWTEHDLRAKAGSDAETLEKARALLQHADARTTQRIYRRRPERV